MGKFVDLTGKQFGKWTVLEYAGTNKYKKKQWKCVCSCEDKKEKIVLGGSLLSGKSQSCGCLHKEILHLLAEDLVGKTFGKLTVIEISNKRTKGHGVIWVCKCDCNDERYFLATSSDLIQGKVKSCGCLRTTDLLPNGKKSLKRLYQTYMQSAKSRKLTFNLSEEYFENITSQVCHYCGANPHRVITAKYANGSYTYNGIDRVDNNEGYLESNTVPCCYVCNHNKRTMSECDFLAWIELVYNHSIKGRNNVT